MAAEGPSVNLPLGSSAPVKSGGNSVFNAIDLQSSAGGFPRLNLGAIAPFNVTQASAVTAGFATFGPAGTPVAGSSVQNPSGGNTIVASSSNSSSTPRIVTGKQIGRAHV